MQELLGPAAEPAGGGRAWLRCSQHDKRRRCGGRRRARPSCKTRGLAAVPVGGGRAWLRCPRAAAGPGRASRRRAEPKARSADDSRAGRRPRAHQAARPDEASHAAAGDQAGPQATTAGKLPTGRHTVFVLISYLVPLFFPSSSITKGKTRDSLEQRPSPTMGTFRYKRKENPGTSMGPGVRWRRMGDSNPRGLAPNTLSKRAP